MSSLLYLVLPLAIDIALTAGCFLGLDLLFKRRWPVVSILASGLLVPGLLAAMAAAALSTPNPQHRDGPGMLFAAMVSLVLFTAPINLIASTLTWLGVRARRKRLTTPGLS